MKRWAYIDIGVYVLAMILCISHGYGVAAVLLAIIFSKRPIRRSRS